MEREQTKKKLSKGERLGWTPLEQVQKVELSSVAVRGRRINVRPVAPEQPVQTSYLIP